MESPLFDVVGNPISFIIIRYNFVPDILDPYKPGWNSFVDKRRVISPAEWVRVIEIIFLNKSAGGFDQRNK